MLRFNGLQNIGNHRLGRIEFARRIAHNRFIRHALPQTGQRFPAEPIAGAAFQSTSMPFPFYDKLTPARQRIYRASDAIARIAMPNISSMQPAVQQIERALSTANRASTEQACQALVNGLNTQMKTPAVRMRVLERRPSDDYGELHGLYEPDNDGKVATITLWMRTAQKEQVVKFRTFLRTLVHEMCHHFDYEHFRLAETFHTDGFYQRESVLLKELLGEPVEMPAPAGPPAGKGGARTPGRGPLRGPGKGAARGPGALAKGATQARDQQEGNGRGRPAGGARKPGGAATTPKATPKPATVIVRKTRTPTDSE
jgi:hypothetical protein